MNAPYHAADPLDAATFAAVRRETIFACCKWDPQFEDVSVLCDYPIVLPRCEWVRLAALAERLAAEVVAAERELVGRTDLHDHLGLPRAVRRALGKAAVRPPCRGPRVLRFDFHYTTEGWQISEVNSDVPGGFIEALGFTRRMADCYPALEMAGDPAGRFAEALAECIPQGARIVLAHATAYTDDRQVMVYLSRRLEAHGLRCCLASPADLLWQQGRPTVQTAAHTGEVDALVRFFPAEWLPDLPRSSGWQHFFHSSCVPLSNPATALVTQSKRFPLVWSRLQTPLPAWKSLLPETVDPRRVNGTRHDEWVFKLAPGAWGKTSR